jgi:hypothetical protein
MWRGVCGVLCGLLWIVTNDLLGDEFVVARVNGDVVTSPEVADRIRAELRALEPLDPDDTRQRERLVILWTQAVRDALDARLLIQAAQRAGIKVAAEEIDHELDRQAEGLGDRSRLEAYYHEMYGLTLDRVRKRVRESLTIRRFLAVKLQIGNRVGDEAIRPADLRAYYQEHAERFKVPAAARLQRIIIPLGDDALDARRLADSVIVQLESGCDFMSICRLLADQLDLKGCGQWTTYDVEAGVTAGFIELATLPDVLSAAIAKTAQGAWTAPIELDKALTIVRVVEHRPAHESSFEEAQEAIATILLQQRRQSAVHKLLEELRRTALIEPPGLYTEEDRRILSPQ